MAHEHLAEFLGAEGVLFVGRAQEKTAVFRTEKHRDANGDSYPWIVKTTGLGRVARGTRTPGLPQNGLCGIPHKRIYVPRTVMLNTDLPGAISLAAQGLTDQTFHIITALRGRQEFVGCVVSPRLGSEWGGSCDCSFLEGGVGGS